MVVKITVLDTGLHFNALANYDLLNVQLEKVNYIQKHNELHHCTIHY